jgi:hypothetical protein
MDARLTRNDKLIESSINTVSDSISTYASDNNQLPSDLGSLKLTGDAKKLVTDNLVTYKKDTKASAYVDGYKTFYYQLCVTYQKASTSEYSSSYYSYGNNNNEYDSYISAYSHPAGEVCYKVSAENYDYNYNYDNSYSDTPIESTN